MLKGLSLLKSAVESLTLSVTDASGQLVRTIDMGSQPAGAVRFAWDGNNESGERLPEGEYTLSAQGSTNGQFSSLPIATFKNIESVNINGSSGIIVNTKEGAVRLTDIAEIA